MATAAPPAAHEGAGLPTLLCSRPRVSPELLNSKPPRRRPVPPALETVADVGSSTDVRVKNTFIDMPTTPPLSGSHRERGLQTCPSTQVGCLLLDTMFLDIPSDAPPGLPSPCSIETPFGAETGFDHSLGVGTTPIDAPTPTKAVLSLADALGADDSWMGMEHHQQAYGWPLAPMDLNLMCDPWVAALDVSCDPWAAPVDVACDPWRNPGEAPPVDVPCDPWRSSDEAAAACGACDHWSSSGEATEYADLYGSLPGLGSSSEAPAAPTTPPAMTIAAMADAPPEPPATPPPPPPPAGPALGSPEFPSLGSQGHAEGECKPCAFVHTNRCQNGTACSFCHLCGPEERKRRRREKLELRKASRRPETPAAAATARRSW